MFFFRIAALFIALHVFSACAGTIDCDPSTSSGGRNYDKWSSVHDAFELKPSATNVTLGNNIPDWSVIYSLSNVLVGVTAGTCSGGTPYINFVLNSQYKQSVGTISDSKIYPTNVPGIGISINEITNGRNVPLEPYPLFDSFNTVYSAGWGFWVNIKFWKIPGKIPMTSGSVTIDGPEVGIMLSNIGGGFIMKSNSLDRIYDFDGGTGYLAGSRILHATLIFQPGTCNIEGDNIRVNMGSYSSGSSARGPWKDASFKLLCPDAYGYGGGYDTNETEQYTQPYNISPAGSITSNTTKNGQVKISVVPYTEVIDANKGIIALDGTGAKGYGVQLAWGDYSMQNLVIPNNPVVLNSYIDVNLLNSGFRAGDTPIGGNAFTGADNTIKMSARYIRVAGNVESGAANAAVEVIATYE